LPELVPVSLDSHLTQRLGRPAMSNPNGLLSQKVCRYLD